VSGSNWSNRNIFNPNEEVLSNSELPGQGPHQRQPELVQGLSGSYQSSVGVFYEGRRGKPYSWTYYNDLNGDGIGGNDLMYIPSAPGSGEVVFRGGATETPEGQAAFWASSMPTRRCRLRPRAAWWPQQHFARGSTTSTCA
jgi:hypothetical protein